MATVDRSLIKPQKEYSIKATCELLDGIDRHTLLRYTRDGRIHARYRQVSENSAKKYYLGQDILDYIDRNEISLNL